MSAMSLTVPVPAPAHAAVVPAAAETAGMDAAVAAPHGPYCKWPHAIENWPWELGVHILDMMLKDPAPAPLGLRRWIQQPSYCRCSLNVDWT